VAISGDLGRFRLAFARRRSYSRRADIVVNGRLALALIRRSGLRRAEHEWVSPDGRRTTAIAEAVMWALLGIATGTE
jgi:hypothetical protein